MTHIALICREPTAAVAEAIWASGFEYFGDNGVMDADAYLSGFGERLARRLTQDEWTEALRAAVPPDRRDAYANCFSSSTGAGRRPHEQQFVGQARRGHGLPGAASDFRPGLFCFSRISRAEARTGSLSSLPGARWRSGGRNAIRRRQRQERGWRGACWVARTSLSQPRRPGEGAERRKASVEEAGGRSCQNAQGPHSGRSRAECANPLVGTGAISDRSSRAGQASANQQVQ